VTDDRFRRAFLLLLVVAISAAFVTMIRDFLLTILLAAIFAGLSYPVYRWLLQRIKHPAITAILTLLFLLAVVIVPLAVILAAAANEALGVTETIGPRLQEIVNQPAIFEGWLQRLPGYARVAPYRDQILTKAGELVGTASAFLFAALSSATRATAIFIFQFVVLLYTMFFFLSGGPGLLAKLVAFLPLPESDKQRMIEKFVSVTRATLKGTVVIGGAQGALGGLAFWAVGFQGAIFWATVMTVLSIVPGIGAAIVWVPAAILLVATGEIGRAVGLTLFCSLVVGTVDNLLRPRLVGRDTQMHELMVFFSTLGGISLFGVMGFILGPILAALFVTVWDMFGTTFRAAIVVPESATGTPPPAASSAPPPTLNTPAG
jgi:predicted PurR-regulated permease PerM